MHEAPGVIRVQRHLQHMGYTVPYPSSYEDGSRAQQVQLPALQAAEAAGMDRSTTLAHPHSTHKPQEQRTSCPGGRCMHGERMVLEGCHLKASMPYSQPSCACRTTPVKLQHRSKATMYTPCYVEPESSCFAACRRLQARCTAATRTSAPLAGHLRQFCCARRLPVAASS